MNEPVALPSKWLVRFAAALRREDPEQIVQVEVGPVRSEAEAIRGAIVSHFGGVHRPIHSLRMLAVVRA